MINSTSYDVAMENTENLAQVNASGKSFSQRDAVVVNPGVITGSVVDYYIIATIPLRSFCKNAVGKRCLSENHVEFERELQYNNSK